MKVNSVATTILERDDKSRMMLKDYQDAIMGIKKVSHIKQMKMLQDKLNYEQQLRMGQIGINHKQQLINEQSKIGE